MPWSCRWWPPWHSPAWRLAHPASLWVGLGASLLLGPLAPVALTALVASLVREWVWRHRATRAGCWARWVIPAPEAWWGARLAALGILLPPGPVWEMHVHDTHRWPGRWPREAADRFRAAYTADMLAWFAARPPDVTVVCTTFNRLTPAERAAIRAAGGAVVPGALHPRLAATMHPPAYARLQRRLFGGVVSTTVRHDPARWTTWMVPPCRHPESPEGRE